MSDWLHWIGRQYYSPVKFAKEAVKHGATRRVAPMTLKAMSWGDRVYLIGRQSKQMKSGHIFGLFQIRRVLGMPEEVTARLLQKGRATLIDLGGRAVHRGCGDYIEGPSYSVQAGIDEIYEVLKEVEKEEKEKDLLMVGGVFEAIAPPVRMADIPFQMGFRKFDGGEFERQRAEGKTVMSGMFYTDFLPQVEDQPAPNEGEATVLLDYQRR